MRIEKSEQLDTVFRVAWLDARDIEQVSPSPSRPSRLSYVPGDPRTGNRQSLDGTAPESI